MKVAELLREDWGTSDWYPVMQGIKKAMAEDGLSLEEAARDQAERFYQDMGYDDVDDATDQIIHIFKLRNKQTTSEARTETKGNWKIQNLSGEMKNFKDADSPEARAWMKTRGVNKMVWNKLHGRWEEDPRIADRELKKQDREWARERREAERAAKPKKATGEQLEQIYRKVSDAIGSAFPDGDPIDHFGNWLERNNFTMDDVDRAFKKHDKVTYYKYLENYWDEYSRDAIADAKQAVKAGHTPGHSPFYSVDDDGKVEAEPNPWKS